MYFQPSTMPSWPSSSTGKVEIACSQKRICASSSAQLVNPRVLLKPKIWESSQNAWSSGAKRVTSEASAKTSVRPATSRKWRRRSKSVESSSTPSEPLIEVKVSIKLPSPMRAGLAGFASGTRCMPFVKHDIQRYPPPTTLFGHRSSVRMNPDAS